MGLFPPAPGGGEEIDHGYKGKGTLLHILTDYNGAPLAVTTTASSGNEKSQIPQLLAKSKIENYDRSLCRRAMVILEADKGYDSYKLRQMLLSRGIFPFIPRRKIGKPSVNRPVQQEVATYFQIESVRWKVERTFAWLKRKCRRLLLRWERKTAAWNAITTLALIHFWKEVLLR